MKPKSVKKEEPCIPGHDFSEEARLLIYSYIPLKEYVSRIASLSNKERDLIQESKVATEGKVFEFPLLSFKKRLCILHEDRLKTGMEKLKTILNFV